MSTVVIEVGEEVEVVRRLAETLAEVWYASEVSVEIRFCIKNAKPLRLFLKRPLYQNDRDAMVLVDEARFPLFAFHKAIHCWDDIALNIIGVALNIYEQERIGIREE